MAHLFDRTNGGKGRAPKFPMPDIWLFLLRYYVLKKDEAAKEHILLTLDKMAASLGTQDALPRLEDLERRLTVLEEKLFAILLAATPDEQIVQMRSEADHELSPYRRKMPASQIEQLQRQYVHKWLLELYGLPRLSLFYMS